MFVGKLQFYNFRNSVKQILPHRTRLMKQNLTFHIIFCYYTDYNILKSVIFCPDSLLKHKGGAKNGSDYVSNTVF